MRLEATNKNVRGGINKPPPLPGRVKYVSSKIECPVIKGSFEL